MENLDYRLMHSIASIICISWYWLNSLTQLLSALVRMMWCIHLILYVLMAHAHKPTYTFCNTLRYSSVSWYWAARILTVHSTLCSHNIPQNHLALDSPLVGDAREKHCGTLKEKPRQGLGGEDKRKDSFKEVKYSMKYVPRIKSFHTCHFQGKINTAF